MGMWVPAVAMEERLDFTERLLARERDPDRLAPPR